MNERIKELVTEFHLYDDYETVDGKQQKIYGFTKDNLNAMIEKIINECTDICYDKEYSSAIIAAETIIEHFGVK